MRFDNQVALVTGAASGIGRALVQQFAAEGAAVVAVDIVEAALHQVVAELQSQGGQATGCVANISSDEDVERMLGIATSTYGRLDILCNNVFCPGHQNSSAQAGQYPLGNGWQNAAGNHPFGGNGRGA
ncbi:MAG: SDR family NAD(P)-dependent oxidoreductase [Chloroflexi bacterium]|nr:MAG: SDR family NAD(P)-dependent oxidoreductase [Chloroflexota bacterium]